jgi:hypothetical protein
LIDAIAKADSTQRVPPLVIARLILDVFKVKDQDEILSTLTDASARWLPPDGGGAGGAGQAIIDRFRNGEDPAAVMNGGDPTPPEATAKAA